MDDSATKAAQRIRQRWQSAGHAPMKGTALDLLNYRSDGTAGTGLSWTAMQSSADSVIRYNLWQLRDKSRVLEASNPTAERIFRLWESNVLSADGMTLRMQVKQETDITLADGKVIKQGALDSGANRAIEDAWWEFWHKRGQCDVSRELTGIELDKLILRTMARDGVALVRLIRGFDNDWGFALQVLEVDQLDLNYNQVLPNGNEVRMSIEVDPWGRRVAAYVTKYEAGDWERSSYGSSVASPQKRTRIPFEGFQGPDDNPALGTILVPMRKRRGGQTLDLPWLTPVIDVLNSLSKAEEAELVAARAEAEKLGFLKASVNAEGSGFTGVAPETRHTPLDSVPGSIQALDPGWEFQGWDPKHPNGNFGEFRKMMMRSIASGVGMAYGSVANDRSDSSFSAERSALNDEREEYKTLQGFYSATVKVPIFSPWLQMALTAGKIKLANGSPLPLAKFDKFNQAFFQGRRWGLVNPLQDVQTYAMMRDRGWKSDSQIVAESGGYLEDVYAEMRQDLALAQGEEGETPLVFGLGDVIRDTATDANTATNPTGKPMPQRQTPAKKPEPSGQAPPASGSQ